MGGNNRKPENPYVANWPALPIPRWLNAAPRPLPNPNWSWSLKWYPKGWSRSGASGDGCQQVIRYGAVSCWETQQKQLKLLWQAFHRFGSIAYAWLSRDSWVLRLALIEFGFKICNLRTPLLICTIGDNLYPTAWNLNCLNLVESATDSQSSDWDNCQGSPWSM